MPSEEHWNLTLKNTEAQLSERLKNPDGLALSQLITTVKNFSQRLVPNYDKKIKLSL